MRKARTGGHGRGVIDLHCHILPGLDDGARDFAEALEMARRAAADGIETVACTPHVHAGLYDNTGPGIAAAVERLQAALDDAAIGLRLHVGADVHLAPDLVSGLAAGQVPTLAGSRYFLLEPPHHVAPPRLDEKVFELLAAGFVPILTHPERLLWIEAHYAMIRRLVAAGAWLQVTGGSLTGRFGRRARYWSERLMEDGMVHLLATDAHDAERRPPVLSVARAAAARRLGEAEAERLVVTRPQAVLDNRPPAPADLPDGSPAGQEGAASLTR